MRVTVLCIARTDGRFDVSGSKDGPDHAFGIIISDSDLPQARALAREMFGIDWDESSRLDRRDVLSLLAGKGCPKS